MAPTDCTRSKATTSTSIGNTLPRRLATLLVVALVASLFTAQGASADEHDGLIGSGVVSGRVSDTAGDPVEGVVVTLLSTGEAGELTAVGGAVTSADGSYIAVGLPTGSYLVHFVGPLPHLAEYYDDAKMPEDATSVEVTDIEAVVGIDAVLEGGVPPALAVSFQPRNSAVAEGWIADTGQAFDEQVGFGWRTPTGDVPERRQCGDREGTDDQVLDTFCHAQTRYERISGIWHATNSPAIWEAAVPNGTYDVEVTMGESVHASRSVHNTIDVEGVRTIDDFVATGLERQRMTMVTVDVTDGYLTLDPTAGVKGRIAAVNFAGVGRLSAAPPEPRSLSFQPVNAPVPVGWEADTGKAYSSERGFGWRSPLGGIATSRQCGDRNVHAFQPFDTFCHAQTRYQLIDGSWQATSDVVVWELAVQNGVYDVTVTMGEARFSFSNVENTVDVEGVRAVDAFIADATERQSTMTVRVIVTDGFLTVDPTSGSNGKIAAIVVAPQMAPGSQN